jgi:hypothetical protein
VLHRLHLQNSLRVFDACIVSAPRYQRTELKRRLNGLE